MQTLETLETIKQNDEIIASIKRMCSKKGIDFTEVYLSIVRELYDIDPVYYVQNKTLYKNREDARRHLCEHGNAIETLKIVVHEEAPAVDENTSKIYICPFSGKVFGNNMFSHPEDAIYDWVAKLPNNEISNSGVRKKRFFVSTDRALIVSYLHPSEKQFKIVYKIQGSGNLFLSQEDAELHLINSLGSMSLKNVLNQNKLVLEPSFLSLCQELLEESCIQKVSAILNDIPQLSEFNHIWDQD